MVRKSKASKAKVGKRMSDLADIFDKKYDQDAGLDAGVYQVIIVKATDDAWPDGRARIKFQCKVLSGPKQQTGAASEGMMCFPDLNVPGGTWTSPSYVDNEYKTAEQQKLLSKKSLHSLLKSLNWTAEDGTDFGNLAKYVGLKGTVKISYKIKDGEVSPFATYYWQ